MKPPLIFVFMLVPNTFKENVRFVGFGNRHHLKIFFLISDDLREREFTYLALKLCEIVALNDSLDLFLDLAINPGLQASNMNKTTASFTVARGNQGIRLSLF